MPRIREDPYFGAAIDAAAELAGLPAGFIEKDYWVTEVLRELARQHEGKFLFKGGTSLSKAYALIERFSEDVDLLVIPADPNDSERVDEMLNAFCTTALGITGGEREVIREQRGSCIDVVLTYSATRPKAPGLSSGVRLDTGIAGGPMPSERKNIRPMLAQFFNEVEGYKVASFDDLAPVELDVLHPSRTLVEKFAAINAAVEPLRALPVDKRKRIRSRDARHFYDVYQLLDNEKSGALTGLRDGGLEAIVADCERVNGRWFVGAKVRPVGGFAAGAAFADAELEPFLKPSYEKAIKELCFPKAARPAWQAVCERVAHHRADL